MASNLENNAPALIVNNLQEAFGLLHPTGEARECLADALEAANQLLGWFKQLQANGIEVNPMWTEFHTEYMKNKALEALTK